MATGHFTQVSLCIARLIQNSLMTILYWKQLAKLLPTIYANTNVNINEGCLVG